MSYPPELYNPFKGTRVEPTMYTKPKGSMEIPPPSISVRGCVSEGREHKKERGRLRKLKCERAERTHYMRRCYQGQFSLLLKVDSQLNHPNDTMLFQLQKTSTSS